MQKPEVIIVGAGPGGLISGMILANKGCKVTFYEKENIPGGRNGYIEEKGYKFDIGPTFLMMKFVLDDIFKEVGRDVNDYLEFVELDPMYRLVWTDQYMDVHYNKDLLKKELQRVFPNVVSELDKFMKVESWRFKKLFPCLTRPYGSAFSLLNKHVIFGLRAFAFGKTLYDVLGNYFDDQKARIAFTFQSKYLGMSPWKCPGLFAMIPYVEHEFGIYHSIGGLSEISAAMAKVAEEEGAKIHYHTTVKQIIVENGKAIGVELENGKKHKADEVIINADFGYAATKLFPKGVIKKWAYDNLIQKRFSVSTFMLYLGLKKRYDLKHHTIVFSKEYIKNVTDLENGIFPEKNASFYVRNADVTDPTLAPKGHSALYILVPVPNKKANINWKAKEKPFRDWIIDQLDKRLGMKDVEENIVVEKIFTPDTWETDYNVFIGATFNLAHNIPQMLHKRPHNKFEEVKNCYLVGGGTHPGSGLPTIYESGRISAGIICKKHGFTCGEAVKH